MTSTTTTTRQPATDVLFPGQASAEITTIRMAWANLMDCGRVVEADTILQSVEECGSESPIVAATHTVAAIEQFKRIVTPVQQAEFEAMLAMRAMEAYPHRPRAREVFVQAGLRAGLYNDAFLKAHKAAEAWLNPPPPTPRAGQTQRNQRGGRLHGVDQLRTKIVRTGTGANGS